MATEWAIGSERVSIGFEWEGNPYRHPLIHKSIEYFQKNDNGQFLVLCKYMHVQKCLHLDACQYYILLSTSQRVSLHLDLISAALEVRNAEDKAC